MKNILIKFPNNEQKQFPVNSTPIDIANSISEAFARKCIACTVNNKIYDLKNPINVNASIVFFKEEENEIVLEILRHSATHLMAQAVKELFPNVKLAIGPVIENGFYYDFLTDSPFNEGDLKTIENKMKEISSRKIVIERFTLPRNEAYDRVKKDKETFKEEIISAIPENEDISFYRQGDFVDMCRGPHMPSTDKIKHFKLTKVSGSYWRGDSKGIKLQRIYGTAWLKKSSLDAYLERLKLAEENDHRKIAKIMDLFHQQPESPGEIFWHPNGYKVFLKIREYIRKKLNKQYKEIKTPALMKRELWERSGHWEKFKQNMISVSIEDEEYAIKPMNCPGHVQVFKSQTRSYKDLPLSFSEFGSCTRWEASGAMHGIMRLRAFTQDDAHIFCMPEQVSEETKKFVLNLLDVYKDFGFEKVKIKLSDRPEARIGNDETWDQAEQALENALNDLKLDFTVNKGEGAFYGPKLEFVLVDNLNRDWQCGTLQIDFFLPERLEAYYIDSESTKKHPIMLHRAILGSIERFIGILIENNGGRFPLWLAPVHVAVCSFTNNQDEEAEKITDLLNKNNINAEFDNAKETINYKIRKHSTRKVPFIAVIGKREIEEGTITIRELGHEGSKTVSLDNWIVDLQEKIKMP